ncbi:MAG: AAA family ATPase [Spirochaetia bacterium]|jgi:class 3 adenylate cyclase/tetratricopeptide (TPR) repeat protein
MICPGCGSENTEDARFCDRCGAKLEKACPTCGSTNRMSSRFCSKCGIQLETGKAAPTHPKLEDVHEQLKQHIAPTLAQKMHFDGAEVTGENRIITALFADISGFTPMSQRMSPEELVEKVNQCFRVVTDTIYRHGGSINKFIGDCVLAFFGAPVAHENDPERAILSAREIQAAVAGIGLTLTVGINTGAIYFGPVGTEDHREVTAYGAEINLAQRLQSTAEAGKIVVGEKTYRMTRRAFEFKTLPPQKLKGIEGEVTAFEVVKLLPRPEKIRGIEGLHAELIGREKELSQLRERVDDLLLGRGQIACVVGQAGVGKSRLALELKGYAEGKGVRCIDGRCVSIGESIPYWPFIDLLRNAFELSPDDAPGGIEQRITAEMEKLFPERWADVAPFVGHLLLSRPGGQWAQRISRLNSEQAKHQTFFALRDLFLTMAKETPLLLVLDDLHWADNLSLDLLSLLIDSLSMAPVMLLCIFRPEHEHRSSHLTTQASGKCLDCYSEIHLNPLSSTESRRLVESLLSIENLPAKARDAILGKAGGNPFFVEEVIRSLIDRGAITRKGDLWEVKPDIGDIDVPVTIQSLILSRIDGLEENVRSILQSAAVIGRLFRERLLEYVTREEERLDQYLWQLEEKDLIYEERAVPEAEYSFKHELTHDTAYGTILVKRRGEFHRRVGEGYETLYSDRLEEFYEDLAHHFSRSDDRQKAVKYLVLAGEKAASRFANTQALLFYQQALERVEGSAERCRILQKRGKVYLGLWKGREASADYEEVLERARRQGKREEVLDAMAGLVKATYMVLLDDPQHLPRLKTLLEEAYRIADEADDKRAKIDLLAWKEWLRDYQPMDVQEWLDDLRKIVNLSRELKDARLERYYSFQLSNMEGRCTEAAELEKTIIEDFRASSDLAGLKEFFFSLMWFHLNDGNFERCIECCDAATKLASDIGAAPVQYATLRAFALLSLGRYSEAWASLQHEVADEAHPFGSAFRQAGTGVYFFSILDYKRAKLIFSEMIAHEGFIGRTWLKNIVLSHVALIEAYTENVAALSENPDAAQQTIGIPPYDTAEVLLALNRPGDALAHAESVCAATKETGPGGKYIHGLLLKMQALAALGKPTDAISVADLAIPIARKMVYLPLLWRLHGLKAQALGQLAKKDMAGKEYGEAAGIIQTLAGSIPDGDSRRTFLSDPRVVQILEGQAK